MWSAGLGAINNHPQVAIVGPSAGGKSDLALSLAADLRAEIVSIDSVQVYRRFDIGSAKPSKEVRQKVVHHLIDICEPGEQYDAARFSRDSEEAVAQIRSRERMPLLVGGTTMYLTAYLYGLADLPARNPQLRAELEKLSDEELFAKLDEESRKTLHYRDRLRIIRAIETEGLPESTFCGTAKSILLVLLLPPREELYERIDRRAERIVQSGILEETEAIIACYGRDLPALKTIGYRESMMVLDGQLARAELVATIAQSTRRFAKRQMTYWANEPRKRGWSVWPEQRPFRANQTKEFVRGSTDSLAERIGERLGKAIHGVEVWLISGKSPIS